MSHTSFALPKVACLAAAMFLAGCEAAEPQPEPVIEEEATPAIELGETGLTVADARMVMAPVPSNPAAVYFDLANTNETDATLQSVSIRGAFESKLHVTSTDGGMASMSEVATMTIPAGETLSLAPGGNHVMAFNVSPATGPGDRVDVTITLDGGREETFKAEVRAAGDER